MTRSQAVRKINQAISGAAKGFFIDDYWSGVRLVEGKLTESCNTLGFNWNTLNAAYEKEDGVDVRKRWTYYVDRGLGDEKNPIIVTCVASGAGSVQDPLAMYDIVAYAS